MDKKKTFCFGIQLFNVSKAAFFKCNCKYAPESICVIPKTFEAAHENPNNKSMICYSSVLMNKSSDLFPILVTFDLQQATVCIF